MRKNTITKEQIEAAVAKMPVEGYKSPIEIVTDQAIDFFEQKGEGAVLEACASVGVHVDRDQLVKALNGDRDQYERGYRRGLRVARIWGSWEIKHDGDRFVYTCSVCGAYERPLFRKRWRFCPYCGAQLLGAEEEIK